MVVKGLHRIIEDVEEEDLQTEIQDDIKNNQLGSSNDLPSQGLLTDRTMCMWVTLVDDSWLPSGGRENYQTQSCGDIPEIDVNRNPNNFVFDCDRNQLLPNSGNEFPILQKKNSLTKKSNN